MTLAVEVAGKTDVGCVRENNEDNFGYDSRYGIFVVCDGMGGQAAGEVASKMGVDVLLEYFRTGPPAPPPTKPAVVKEKDNGAAKNGADQETSQLPIAVSADAGALAGAIHMANRKIYEAGQNDNGRSGMGSTVVAALLHGNAMVIGHVGDSRIYLVRKGAIQQLTRDHSLVAEQVRLGYITPEQAATSELQNVILRALGAEAEVQPEVEDLVALPGDVLLMTSDGLTRHVRDQEILEAISSSPSLEVACDKLIQAAKDRGGEDNITCLLLKMVERPWYKSLFNKLFSGGPQWQNSI
jgi:protein phosphatase